MKRERERKKREKKAREMVWYVKLSRCAEGSAEFSEHGCTEERTCEYRLFLARTSRRPKVRNSSAMSTNNCALWRPRTATMRKPLSASCALHQTKQCAATPCSSTSRDALKCLRAMTRCETSVCISQHTRPTEEMDPSRMKQPCKFTFSGSLSKLPTAVSAEENSWPNLAETVLCPDLGVSFVLHAPDSTALHGVSVISGSHHASLQPATSVTALVA